MNPNDFNFDFRLIFELPLKIQTSLRWKAAYTNGPGLTAGASLVGHK